MLLTDFFVLDTLEVIEESKSKGTMKVRGTFQRAEEANSNNRVYPRAVLESQVVKLQDLIKERRLCGELDHPQNDTVKLSNASHLVTKLWMQDNDVLGEAEILNTPSGKVAQALINDGVKIGISSRGLGTVTEGMAGKIKTVNDDFRLVTFDLVADPSTRGAYPEMSESAIHLNEKYERTMNTAISENIFTTLLKNKLNEGIVKKVIHKVGTAVERHGKKALPSTLAPWGPGGEVVDVTHDPRNPFRSAGQRRRRVGRWLKRHGEAPRKDEILVALMRDRVDEVHRTKKKHVVIAGDLGPFRDKDHSRTDEALRDYSPFVKSMFPKGSKGERPSTKNWESHPMKKRTPDMSLKSGQTSWDHSEAGHRQDILKIRKKRRKAHGEGIKKALTKLHSKITKTITGAVGTTPKKKRKGRKLSPEDQVEHPMTYTKHDYDED